jgi:hypothetical protein
MFPTITILSRNTEHELNWIEAPVCVFGVNEKSSKFLGPNEVQRQIHPPFRCVHLLCTLALQLGGKPKCEQSRVRLSRETPPERVRERQPEWFAFGAY